MGKTSVAELKEQMAMAKAEVEAFQKDNATRGKEVKEEVDALRKARKEQTDRIFEDAFSFADEILFYASPLVDKWRAPPHAYVAHSCSGEQQTGEDKEHR